MTSPRKEGGGDGVTTTTMGFNSFDDDDDDDWDKVYAHLNHDAAVVLPQREVYSDTICRVKVNFPYKPYKSQKQLMTKVIEGAHKGQNCLLESPTGTGQYIKHPFFTERTKLEQVK